MVRHKKTKSIFALKKIPKEMIKSHFMVDQLALEIKLQSYLDHKNILGIYNFFDDATHLYILLEYMDQGTLYSQLKKDKILTEAKAAGIIKQITEAVDYLHDQDIAHRDIKP
jgi:serine/threonine protein kinase